MDFGEMLCETFYSSQDRIHWQFLVGTMMKISVS
jgi:hypothetical protein